jgi:hypothetical protein
MKYYESVGHFNVYARNHGDAPQKPKGIDSKKEGNIADAIDYYVTHFSASVGRSGW